jgi:hypothetical protein
MAFLNIFLNNISTIVTFSQIAVLYWLVTPTTLRLMYRSYLNKNRAWVEANPAFAAGRVRPAYAIGLSLAIGLGWMIFLARGMRDSESASWQVWALMLPMLAWLALELAVAAVEYRRICQPIPLPDRRRAALERRSLRLHAHPAAIVPGFLMLVLLCMAYVVAYCHDLIEADLLAWRLLGIAIGCAIWCAALHHCVHRKPQPADEALGPLYRRAEVLGTIACLYLFVVAAGFRALQELCAVYLMADVGFFTAASIVLQVVLLFWTGRVIPKITHPTEEKK